MELTTPSLLFPAISLLLAYNNRFQTLGLLIRQMTKEGADEHRPRYKGYLQTWLETNRLCKQPVRRSLVGIALK